MPDSKPKFNPEITMVKLNPEQAVLTCTCYMSRRCVSSTGTSTRRATICYSGTSRGRASSYCSRSTRSSASTS